MLIPLVFTSLLLQLLLLPVHVNTDCVWYGIGKYESPEHPRYIAYNGPAKPLNDSKAYEILRKLCPNYATGFDVALCCDPEQLKFFSDSAKVAYEMLRRCPGCWANFRLLLCGMTCDPDQANFITPTVEEDLVQSAEMRLTARVADTFYNSCKDVNFGGGRAVDAICTSSPCNRDALLAGLGGDRSPFPVQFKIVNESTPSESGESGSFDTKAYRCNESVPRRGADTGGPACSCIDCESSCTGPPPIPPHPQPGPLIFGFDAWWVSGVIAFVILVLIFATYEIASHVYRHRHGGSSSPGVDSETRRLHDSDAVCQSTESNYYSAYSPNCLHRLRALLEDTMSWGFCRLGFAVARHPFITLFVSVVISVALCAGLTQFSVTTNPVELWSGPNSRSRLEKDYYDQHFVPFYRTEQLIIRPQDQEFFKHMSLFPASGDSYFGPALKKEFLLEVLDLQQKIQALSVYSPTFQQNITLDDICFKPLEPDNLNCAVTSPLEYFQSNITAIDEIGYDEFDNQNSDYLDHLMFCANAPLSVVSSVPDKTVSCLASSGIPMTPTLVFGGFNGTKYNESTCVVLTFLVNNDPNPKSDRVHKAELWEEAFLKLVRAWTDERNGSIIVSFQAERSVEDEINRQSEADIKTVLISYIVMFVYVSLFLASYRSCKTVFVDLRVVLGLGGVIMVIISVVASVGMWSYIGTPATLIIIEVIPFLVLAVGVDNIFILVHDFEFDEKDADALLCTEERRQSCAENLRRQQGEQFAEEDAPLHPHPNMTKTIRSIVAARMGRTLGRVGPSLLLTSAAESVAFFCGSLTSMPAVKVFALYAGVAIIFNFLLQLFAFVALLTLDARRRAANRFDVFCCFGLKSPPETAHVTTLQGNSIGSPQSGDRLADDVDSLSLSSSALDDVQLTSQTAAPTNSKEDSKSSPWLHRLIANGLTPCLLSGWVRPIVIVLSLAWLCFCVAIIPNGISIGLDQRLAMPKDSYMLDYFNAMTRDLRVGPPLYFVVTHGHTYDDQTGQNQVCGGIGCPQTSLAGAISDASRISTYSSIATPASSWLDDYFDWIDPDGAPYCCRVYPNSTDHCPDSEPVSRCVTCPVHLEDGRPDAQDFHHYLKYFLEQNPSTNCPKGGRAPYNVAVQRFENGSVGATYFMTYHTVLQEPSDFINALKRARDLADRVNGEWHANDSTRSSTNTPPPNSVFPYSVFYVYYEQYLSVAHEALVQIGICLAAIIGVTFLLLGLNVVATLMVLFGVIYIVLSLGALMVLWDISLNAISLVNLVVTVGIAVEFCAHIVRAFAVSTEPTRLRRAKAALSDMGSSILRGITLTKLGGILVLRFSKSRLFEVFYFRMYLGIILFGAATGLIVLPVYLSYIGPSLNKALARKYRDRLTERNYESDADRA